MSLLVRSFDLRPIAAYCRLERVGAIIITSKCEFLNLTAHKSRDPFRDSRSLFCLIKHLFFTRRNVPNKQKGNVRGGSIRVYPPAFEAKREYRQNTPAGGAPTCPNLFKFNHDALATCPPPMPSTHMFLFFFPARLRG